MLKFSLKRTFFCFCKSQIPKKKSCMCVIEWIMCHELIFIFCLFLCLYLKCNNKRFDASKLSIKSSGASAMRGFRCGEITCNTINVLSIRFKYWIKNDSDKMYSKMERLMLLLAQPRCIAAGCSPGHVKRNRALCAWAKRGGKKIEKRGINNSESVFGICSDTVI